MNFEEHAAKPLLAATGISVPRGMLAATPDEAAQAAAVIGACVVKAQVPTGKRGKAGGIKTAATPEAARDAAAAILGMTIGEHTVEKVLVEEAADIAGESYAAVMNDPASKGPLLLYAAEGGMDIEELSAGRPDALLRLEIDIRHGPDGAALRRALAGSAPAGREDEVAEILEKLYAAYAAHDAELLEINPLATLTDGRLVALDAKFTMDDSGAARQAALAGQAAPEILTELEARGREAGLKYIELDGDVGVLANGAGLTMTTMDSVRHFGGSPANFLEIGGEAYRLGKEALGLVLDNPRVRSLVVNFCGAFARTDVMTEGIVTAWEELRPDIPVFFSIHGTGDAEAIALLKDRLGMDPFDHMDDAVKAAVDAAAAKAAGHIKGAGR
ncbi:MAG: acetate--CoA ligase family protein [Alphaproteobacteria bacterium]|nr:acetate--CoA ligase family protein [Alphaproteobacteria bacterium]